MKSGDLNPKILISAYTNGYFPMPDPDDETEIAWFNPDPRAVIPLDGFHCSRSLAKVYRRGEFQCTIDGNFAGVIAGCADRPETWINPEFIAAYTRLFELGFAHSVEVLRSGQLVGGVYGVSLRGAFFAESMFHRDSNASKIALLHLVQHLRQRGFLLLEVQFLTPHLKSLGAVEIPRHAYLLRLEQALNQATTFR
jgi:leucyl/phenylalanyl-tRNA---protein transferase